MDSSQRDPRVLWSFWLAAGLAATGAIATLLLTAGGTDRIAAAVIPFGVAAMAMAVNALTYQRGKPLATSLYFLAGIALVYGMLSMVAVPLRLAVIGTCPPDPAACPAGFERPFTTGEGSAFTIGIAMGTLAILVGFFGLLMLYRIRTQPATPPPVRRDAPWVPPPAGPSTAEATKPQSEPEVPSAAAPAPQVTPPESAPPETGPAGPVAPPKPPRKPRAKRTPKPQPELAALAEPLELPAPDEPLELPSHSSSTEPIPDPPSST
jgi:hypothetical protein